MLSSQKTWAGSPLTLKNFACLTHEEKVSVASCYDENFICHEALKETSKPAPPNWGGLAIMLLSGIVVGGLAVDLLRR